MRILHQSSERNDVNNIKVYRRDRSQNPGIQIPLNKLILFVSIGFVVMVVVIVVVVVVVTKKKKDEDSEGTLFNSGFFYPSDDPNNLHKCTLENCQVCHGSIFNNTCDNCFPNSTALKTKDIIYKCEPKSSPTSSPTTSPISPTSSPISPTSSPISPTSSPISPTLNKCIEGENENCLKCNEEQDDCLSCNPGFFLPDDLSQNLKCLKCPIKYCKKCSGSALNPSCLSCENHTIPDSEIDTKNCKVQIGEGPFCKTADAINNECVSCNDGYNLENGKCILNYHFKAIFKTRTKNEDVKLIGKYYYIVEEMIVDGKKLDKNVKSFTFENKGDHIVYYKIKLPKNGSLLGMFEGLKKMTSISFSELFDFSYVTNMNRMFYDCQNLKNIDLSGINSQNLENMEYMFYQNLELNSIDLSELESSKVSDASNMFENCISLKSIDISNFNSINIEINEMFKGIPDSGTITVNENLKSEISSLLPDWNVITK